VTIEVLARRPGAYMLVVHYANDERDTGHPYNTDIISPAPACPAPCRNVLDSEWAPNLDRFEIAAIRTG